MFVNGVDITNEVFSISVNDRPDNLMTAHVELYVESINTTLVDAGRVEITYNLGKAK